MRKDFGFSQSVEPFRDRVVRQSLSSQFVDSTDGLLLSRPRAERFSALPIIPVKRREAERRFDPIIVT